MPQTYHTIQNRPPGTHTPNSISLMEALPTYYKNTPFIVIKYRFYQTSLVMVTTHRLFTCCWVLKYQLIPLILSCSILQLNINNRKKL